MVSSVSSSGSNMAAEMWSRMIKSDSNSDGALSKTEMKSDFDKVSKSNDGKGPDFDEMFSQMDANGDGSVTQEEFTSFDASHKPPAGPPPGGKDGQSNSMSISDMQESLWKSLLSAKDSDSSNSLSKSELFGSTSSTSSSKSSSSSSSSAAAYMSSIASKTSEQYSSNLAYSA